MPTDDPRHRRRRIRRQPSARSARRDGARRRRLASARRRAAARQRRACAGRRSTCSIAARSARRSRARGRRAVYHCAGAAHVGQAWDATESTFAINVRGTHHLLEALERARRRRARPDPELGAGLRGRRRAADRGRIRSCPSSPYGLSKLAQEMLGAGDATARSPSRSRARSTTSARGRIRFSPRRASRAASPTSSAGAGRRRSRSAISTRGAISPTCAIRCAPTG